MEAAVDATSAPALMELTPSEATQETFKEFGQVIEASPDGDEFGRHDAQLDLTRGTSRFYIMRLENRPLSFSTITHHASVTQCLGSICGHIWYLGVAKSTIVDSADINEHEEGKNIVKSKSGHFYAPPTIAGVVDHTTHNFKKDNGVIFKFHD